MKVAVPLAKNILPPLGIHRKTTLIIANQQMDGIMKIVQALEDSNILLKEVTKTIKNETKEQKRGFFGMLLGAAGANLLGKMLAGKGIVKAGSRNKKRNCEGWF